MESAIPAEHREPTFDLPDVRRVQPRVDDAAEALLARGIAPTVERVRAAIGGASPNSVAPALRYWRLRRDRALGKAPDPVPSPVLAAARTLYDIALDVAARSAGSSQAELAAQLEAERAKSASLAAELKYAKREIDTLRGERASLFEAAGRTHSELVQAQALATHCVAEQRALQRRLDAAHRDLGAARAEIAAMAVAVERTKLSTAAATRTRRKPAPRRAKIERTQSRKPSPKKRPPSTRARRKRAPR
jgi:hypothetical protein